MKSAVIYVAGLGDWRSRAQRAVVWCWRVYGVKSEVTLMNWHIDEPFETKLDRLITRIDTLHAAGYQVSLVGVSAGASAVINAFALRKDVVQRVVCICGKLQHPETIHPATFQRNPAFAESLQRLPDSLAKLLQVDRQRISSIRPLADESVPPSDTVIPGATGRTIPTVGHVLSIAASITLFSPVVLAFIRRR